MGEGILYGKNSNWLFAQPFANDAGSWKSSKTPSGHYGISRYNANDGVWDSFYGVKYQYAYAASTINSNTPVAQRDDGKLDEVGYINYPEGIPWEEVHRSGFDTWYKEVGYFENQDRVMLAWMNGNETNLYGSVAKFGDGKSLTVTSSIYLAYQKQVQSLDIAYDSDQHKMIVAYTYDGGGQDYCAVRMAYLHSNNDGISKQYENIVDNDVFNSVAVAYHPIEQRVVVAYKDSNYYGVAVVGQIAGGGGITWGSKTTFNAEFTDAIEMAYDANANAIVISFSNINDVGHMVAGTVSGSTITFGSPNSIDNYGQSQLLHDAVSGYNLVCYGNSFGAYIAVTSVSGTSVNYLSKNNIGSGIIQMCPIDTAGEFVVIEGDYNNYDTKYLKFNINSAGVSVTKSKTYLASGVYVGKLVYAPTADVAVMHRERNNDELRILTFSEAYSASNAHQFVGISTSYVTSGNVCEYYMAGGVATMSGLTAGATYYLYDNGTLTTTDNGRAMGRALESETILLEIGV